MNIYDEVTLYVHQMALILVKDSCCIQVPKNNQCHVFSVMFSCFHVWDICEIVQKKKKKCLYRCDEQNTLIELI